MADLIAYLALALSLLACAAFFWAFGWIRLRLSRLFAGERGESLGDALAGQGKRIASMEKDLRALSDQLEALTHRLEEAQADVQARLNVLEERDRAAIRHVHVHTYTVGDGAPESAVLVAADEAGRGWLLNILSGKTVRVYAREVANWQAGRVSQDEEEALREARRKAEKGG